MKHRMLVAVATVLAVVGPACSQQVEPSSSEQAAIAVGETAPSFSLESASGDTVGLSDYSRKPVLLYFSMGPG